MAHKELIRLENVPALASLIDADGQPQKIDGSSIGKSLLPE